MSIEKIYEISCNECGCCCHYSYSIRNAEYLFKEEGGIIKNKKHYCDEECYKKAVQKQKNKR